MTAQQSIFLCLLMTVLFFACNTSEHSNSTTALPSIDSIPKEQHRLTTAQQTFLNNIKGKWILADFIDGIYQQQSILKPYVRTPLIYSGIFVEIKDTCVQFCGSIYGRNQPHPFSFNHDSLGQIKVFEDSFRLFFNPSVQRLGFTHSNQDTFWLRKFNSQELALLIPKEKVHNAYEQGFTNLINHQLFKGTYELQGNSKSTIVLNADGTIEGSSQWKSYLVDNWFGTLHWIYQDLIYFKLQDGSYEIWTWKFDKQDRNLLILYKVEGLEDDMKVTKQSITLKRRSQNKSLLQ